MLFPVQNAMDFVPVEGVKYIKQYRPMRYMQWLGYLRGIATADVAYLPKAEIDGFCRIVAKIFRTKVFTTVEGLISETDLINPNNNAKISTSLNVSVSCSNGVKICDFNV